MDAELRCDHKLHAKIVGDRLECKCSSRFCGAGLGIVVLHYFDLITGEFVGTVQFRSPSPLFEPRIGQESAKP